MNVDRWFCEVWNRSHLQQLEETAQRRMSLEPLLKRTSNHTQSRKEGTVKAAVCALGGIMNCDSLA